MKALVHQIDPRTKGGLVRLVAEDPENMYNVHQLIRPGDGATTQTATTLTRSRFPMGALVM